MIRTVQLLCITVLLGSCACLTLRAQSQEDDRNLFRLAQQYERGGDYRNASRIYERLYNADPDNFSYFDGYRRMLMQLREYDRAIAMTEERVEMNPRDVNLLGILGGMYYQAERREKAFEIWENTLQIEPRNIAPYQQVASRMIENRLLYQAIDVYKK